MTGPLSGVVVLDLTRLLPGAYCTWLLSSLGAEVIKIEEPIAGDYQREFAPFVDGVGAMYQMLNAGKASVALNLKDPEAAGVFVELVAARADAVVESFRPGVMSRLGLGPERLRAVRPSLVYAALTGYGSDGPLAGTAGHDINYLAEAGLIASADQPTMTDVPWADVIGGGMLPALGVAALLCGARVTGQGASLDMAMMEGLALLPRSALVDALVRHSAESAGRTDNTAATGSAPLPYYRVYELADGRIAVGAVESKFWMNLCDALGMTEYREAQHDSGRHTEMIERLSGIFERMTRSEAESLFGDLDACVTVIGPAADVLDKPLARSRDWVRDRDDALSLLGSPFVVDGQRAYSTGSAPTLGADTIRILTESGIAATTVSDLIARGAAKQPVIQYDLKE